MATVAITPRSAFRVPHSKSAKRSLMNGVIPNSGHSRVERLSNVGDEMARSSSASSEVEQRHEVFQLFVLSSPSKSGRLPAMMPMTDGRLEFSPIPKMLRASTPISSVIRWELAPKAMKSRPSGYSI